MPVDLSVTRLDELVLAGYGYEYRIFEGLGHNNMEDTFTFATKWIQKVSLSSNLTIENKRETDYE